MKLISKARRPIGKWRRQTGQTLIIVVIAVAVFLLAVVGLAVDFSHLWLHRQMAQGAADAACQAGAMDLLDNATGASVNPGFVIGNDLTTCNGLTTQVGSTPPAVPCWYAAQNGYDSAGGATLPPNTESNNVAIKFLTSISGVTPPPSSLAGPKPYMRVDVTDRVKVFFSALLTGSKTQDVVATAKCGLVLSTSPIPIVVLHPTMKDAFNISGTPAVKIYGGPTQSVQVNSDFTGSGDAANIGGTSNLDLTQGGPAHTGSDFGVFGDPSTETACATPTSTNCWFPGTTSHWFHSSPISDPFQAYPTPSSPGVGGTCFNGASPHVCFETVTCCDLAGNKITDATHDQECPVDFSDTGHNCTRFYPGSYSDNSMQLSNANALFVPGLYYMSGTGPNKGLQLGSNTLARPSALPGDSSGGVTFFFTGTATLNVGAQSGLGWTSSSFPPASFDTSSPVAVRCPGGDPPDPPLPATFDGNVFLGPCTGAYLGGSATSPARGLVFFQDRSVPNAGTLGGGGGLLLAGSIYYHQLSSYGSIFQLNGHSGSDTRVLGNIIVDQLNLGGGGSINMVLNPNSVFSILKVQLLQ
jgi:Flp pilus assembly protein TadG